MGIVIDVTQPEGNIFAVMGRAANVMRQLGRTPAAIKEMQAAVRASENYEAACAIVTKATDGLVVFENPNDDRWDDKE